MAFATYDEIVAALAAGRGQEADWSKQMPTFAAGRAYSSWRRTGVPGAGSDPSALAARKVDRTVAGALGFAPPTGGRTLHLLRASGGSGTSGIVGTLFLVDRLLDYGGVQHNSNALQALTNAEVLSRYAEGKGVRALLEVSTALGATAQNCTLTYTNDQGVGSRSTGAMAIQASAVQDGLALNSQTAGLYFPLQSGDAGMRSVEGVQFSAANSAGVSNLVLVKPLLYLPVLQQGVLVERDLVLQLSHLPKVEDEAALQWLFLAGGASTTPTLLGQVAAAEG